MKAFFTILFALIVLVVLGQPPVVHSSIGQSSTSADGGITITNIGKKQQFDWRDKATLDTDVFSPKSVNFLPDGTKYYVNSLEGCATVVYRTSDNEKVKVIPHRFKSGTGPLWAEPSGIYRFTHYPDGASRAFSGKPVEGCFSHGGRYLWVPYYRRTFDINAQDPSALAIIDTQADSIVRMMETGPLPKMIACSHDNKTIVVTHWGNNTVGLIDITGDDPTKWHHTTYIAIDHELQLNFSLTSEVNRDVNSGLMLRGTVFTADDHYLLVSCMGGGGIAVVDLQNKKYVGKIGGISNARHLIINHGFLYASVNAAGLVQRSPIDKVMKTISQLNGNILNVEGGWQVCHVGGGARTIEASPSGRWVFAACNSVSALYVVDTQTMTVATQIPVDSYPVGLDISRDGHLLVVTSQARNYKGGNAVNLFRVEYGNEEAEANALTELSQQSDSIADAETANDGDKNNHDKTFLGLTASQWPIAGMAAVLALLFIIFILRLIIRKK
ncbi:MAG: hypothetical protein J6S96_02700 [Muribaculaceae bacterium]|nr:hypothetical protein [Muribaculaceae bacterium]